MEETAGVAESVQNAGEEIITKTSTFINWFKGLATWDNLFKVLSGVVVILLLWIVYRLILRTIRKSSSEKMNQHKQQMLSHFVKYIFYIVVILEVLSLFGIKLSALLGAAGIAGVAIGFAAQTSVSNMISGVFVLTEGSIKIGDAVTVDGVTGIVDEINLLSIHIHTYDNEMVRIPNATIINSNFKNISFHPWRRMTVSVSVSYDTDLTKALETLRKVPVLCPSVLAEPAPAVWFDSFGSSGVQLTLACWFKSADFFQTKNDMFINIKKVFDEAGITIPFNQLDVRIKEDDEITVGEKLNVREELIAGKASARGASGKGTPAEEGLSDGGELDDVDFDEGSEWV